MQITLPKASAIVTAIGVLAGAAWFVGKPAAEQFVVNTVADKIDSMGTAINVLTDKIQGEDVAQVRTESDLASVKAMQKQTQDSLDILLERSVRRP